MNTDNILKESKAKFDHNLAKFYLKEKYQSKLIFAAQGGLWKAEPKLISLLNSFNQDNVVVLDEYENPILINKNEMIDKALAVYSEAMNEWHEEYSQLVKQR